MMDNKIKNRHKLKDKDIKNIDAELNKNFNKSFFNKLSNIEIGYFQGQKILLIEGKICFMFYNDNIFFTLHGLNRYIPKNKFVVVDMGAVKSVTNGADVMAPGIVDADLSIGENDQVWICDETYNKPLAIGIALMSGEQMVNEKNGKAIKVIHHVGDSIWNFVAKSL